MRPTRTVWIALLGIAALCGCAPAPDGASADDGGDPAAPTAAPVAQADPDDPTILRRPFTAEQIRDTLTEGTTLELRRTTPDGETFERWTVVEWSAEHAAIRFDPIDAEGNLLERGEVRVSSWYELRDHATFPAVGATREETTRDTPLGSLDGWLYTVTDAEAGTVTEFFFAHDYPGAPVHFRQRSGDTLLMELVQLRRSNPD